MYIDGKFVKVNRKALEAFTPGVFKAKGVFETMLAVDGKVFDVPQHLQRLHHGFKGAQVSSQMITQVVKANGFLVARVRIVAWREGRHKHTAVMALKYTMAPKKIFKVCVIKTHRPASSRFANIKSLDYHLFFQGYRRARAQGFDEALLVNARGYIFEASRANVFWVKKGKLYTPPLSSGCLNGITRQQVIQYAHRLKIPFQERNVTVGEIQKADTIFITNSLMGIKSCFL